MKTMKLTNEQREKLQAIHAEKSWVAIDIRILSAYGVGYEHQYEIIQTLEITQDEKHVYHRGIVVLDKLVDGDANVKLHVVQQIEHLTTEGGYKRISTKKQNRFHIVVEHYASNKNIIETRNSDIIASANDLDALRLQYKLHFIPGFEEAYRKQEFEAISEYVGENTRKAEGVY